jgi:signal transduction histidine kinase
LQLERKRQGNDELRILVVAPTGRDAALLCAAMSRAGVDAVECRSCEEACLEMQHGAGGVIVAEEALTPSSIQQFAESFANQPPWSDFPLILLTLAGAVTPQSQSRQLQRKPLTRALELERPIRPETLVSTVQSAIRSRMRQYELRDQLAKQQDAHEALLRSEKLAVVGRLAATIAHEINNPLEATVNLMYLARTSPSRKKSREYLTLAESELARVASIATETLKFYRQPNNAAQVQVSPIIESLLVLYQGKLQSARIRVEKDFRQDKPIFAFGSELRQVFANLLSNAIDASAGATLKIKIRRRTDAAGNAGLAVVFADSGGGIPSDVKSNIFEPFVNTKGARGTGLGLWVSAQIVQKHGGRIRVKSSTNPQRHGTVFSVFLPVSPPGGVAEQATITAPLRATV